MEGRQPNRHQESLSPRQKRVFAVVSGFVLLLLAGVGGWAATAGGSYGRSSNGCVNVVVPSTTGGGILHKCGTAAKILCHDATTRHDRLARLTREQCRQAGIRQASGQPAP